MRIFLVLAAVFVLFQSVARADPVPEFAWFTLESTTCTDVNVLFEGPGQTLTIDKNNDASCNLTLGYNVTANYATLAGYAFQLFNTPDVHLLAIDQSPGDLLGFETHFSFNTPGSFLDVGGLNFAPEGSPGGLVTRITIRIDKPSASGVHHFFGNYGSSAQAYSVGYYWYGRVGPNQFTYGGAHYNPGGWGPLPVITINNIPEPVTAGILFVSSILMLGRRRRASRI